MDTLLSGTFQKILQAQDKKPLYQYRLNNKDYLLLKQYLTKHHQELLNDAKCSLYDYDKAFVLYASEWWRREYQGHWRWEDLLTSVGLQQNMVKNSQLLTITEKGLKKWGRAIQKNPKTGRRNALSSFMMEGGLPIAYFNASGGWLESILRGALTRLAQESNHEPYIQEKMSHRTGTSGSEEIVLLLCHLAKSIYELIEDYQLDNEDNPIDCLNRKKPDWQEELPFPLEEQSAQDLLINLITESLKERTFYQSKKQKNQNNLDVFEYWQQNIKLVRVIDINNNIITLKSSMVISQVLKLPQDDIENIDDFLTFSLIKQNENGSNVIYQWQTHLVANQGYLKSRQIINPKLAQADWLCGFVIKTSDAVNDNVRIKNDEYFLTPYQNHTMQSIDVNTPFLASIDKDDSNLSYYVGGNSQFTKDEKAVIYIPNHFKKIISAHSKLEKINDIFNGELYYLMGTVNLTYQDKSYQLSTNCQDANYYYQIKGRQLLNFIYPSLTFADDFKIVKVNQENNQDKSVVSNANILLKQSGAVRYQKYTDFGREIPLGVYQLLIKSGDNIVFSQNIGIVPHQFRYKTVAQNNEQGKIIFDYVKIETILLKNNELDIDIFSVPDDKNSFIFSSQKLPVNKMALELITNSKKQIKNLVLSCHFPSSKTIVVDGDNKLLPNNYLLNINDNLYGYRIKIYNAQRPRQAKLSFYLNSNPTVCIEKNFELKPNRITELLLYDWREVILDLMKFSQKKTVLDDYVIVEYYDNINQGFKLSFVNYNYELYRHQDSLELRINSSLSYHENFDNQQLENLKNIGKLSAINFAKPKEFGVDLCKDQYGNWEFSVLNQLSQEHKDKLSSWLISYQIDDGITDFSNDIQHVEHMVRPIAYTPECLYGNELKKNDRLKKIYRNLVELSNNPTSSDWQLLRELTENTLHLPLISLDQWNQARYCPEFIAAMSVFAQSLLGMDIAKKAHEELGIHYEFINIHFFKKLLLDYKNLVIYQMQVVKENFDDEEFNALVDKSVNYHLKSLKELPVLNKYIQILNQYDRDGSEVMANQQIVNIMINSYFEQLYRNSIDKNWHNPESLTQLVVKLYLTIPKDSIVTIDLIKTHPECTLTALLPIVLAWLSCQKEKSDEIEVLAGSLYQEILAIYQVKYFNPYWFENCFEMAINWFYFNSI